MGVDVFLVKRNGEFVACLGRLHNFTDLGDREVSKNVEEVNRKVEDYMEHFSDRIIETMMFTQTIGILTKAVTGVNRQGMEVLLSRIEELKVTTKDEIEEAAYDLVMLGERRLLANMLENEEDLELRVDY